MADGINGLNGYGYGINGYTANSKQDTKEEEKDETTTTKNYEETQVDPSKVMDFLAQNNYFMPPTVDKTQGTQDVNGTAVDAETEERIAGYMENFEMIYGVVEKEFGTEMAPKVMDLVMDKLMDIAA